MTRDEVAADQRRRIFKSLATSMARQGYAATTIADIIVGAGVSRHTFYEQFDSKQACFMAGYARLQRHVVDSILAQPTSGTPDERFGGFLRRYLATLAADADTSRLYLVEVFAAGSEAMSVRLELQEQFVAGVVGIYRARTKRDRFACRALVASISALVTYALVDGDAEAVLALYEPIRSFAERLQLGRSASRTTHILG